MIYSPPFHAVNLDELSDSRVWVYWQPQSSHKDERILVGIVKYTIDVKAPDRESVKEVKPSEMIKECFPKFRKGKDFAVLYWTVDDEDPDVVAWLAIYEFAEPLEPLVKYKFLTETEDDSAGPVIELLAEECSGT